MATPFVHTLLPFDTYEAGASDTEGAGQATAGRTRWTFTLEVAEVTSVTVVIQGAAVDDDDEYTTLGTFNSGAIASTGTYTLTSPTDFTVQPYHEYLRAKVTAQTGDATVRVVASAPFVDPTISADKDLVSKALREWDDGLVRTVEQAERDVRSLLLHRTYAETADLQLAVGRAVDEDSR